MFKRSCPICNAEIKYSGNYELNRATKRNASCRQCTNRRIANGLRKTPKIELVKAPIKVEPLGDLVFDKSPIVFKSLLIGYNKAAAEKKAKYFLTENHYRDNLRNGPMLDNIKGNPKVWQGWYRGVYFRSGLELGYILQCVKQGIKWRSAECLELAMPFVQGGVAHNHFADFLIKDSILIECKPYSKINDSDVLMKKKIAEAYCKEAGIRYTMTNSASLPDKQFKDLVETGVVKLVPSSLNKFKEKFKKK